MMVPTPDMSYHLKASEMSDGVQGRDQRCCVTDHPLLLRNAHMVPEAEVEWFRANAMFNHNINHTLDPADMTRDARNGITLHASLHAYLEEGRFAFVPKVELHDILPLAAGVG